MARAPQVFVELIKQSEETGHLKLGQRDHSSSQSWAAGLEV